MDWQTQGEEKLENLPSREKFTERDRDRYRYYHGWNFPYRRVMRWLESKAGKHVDSVVHEYVNADWIPVEFRTKHNLHKYLEVNTFIFGGKVCFYDDCRNLRGNQLPYQVVDNQHSKTLYVDPRTGLVCVHRPKTGISYAKRRQAELDAKVRILGDYHQLYKLDGIWYEIKAEIIPEQRVYSWSSFRRKNPRDILLEQTSGWTYRTENKPCVRITLKRQISSKELKKHSLKND